MYIRAFQKMLDNHPGEVKMYRRVEYMKTPEPELLKITGDTGGGYIAGCWVQFLSSGRAGDVTKAVKAGSDEEGEQPENPL